MRIVKLCLAAGLASLAASAAAPTISNVTNGANFSPNIASATWISIFGANFASTQTSWGSFPNGALPTSLAGVSVTVNGIPAYIAFANSTQINALAPDDPTTGMVNVVVTTSGGASTPFKVNKQTYAPALFAYSQDGFAYAVVQDGVTYAPIGPAGLLGKSVTTARATPGENVILWATGLGPTSPPQPTGQLVTSPAPVANPLQITIGGATVTPQFVGLVGSGLYQINLAMPLISSGDQIITIQVGTTFGGQSLVTLQPPNPPVGSQTYPTLSGCLTGQVDYITYSSGRLPFGAPDDVSIGGTDLCQSCNPQTPPFGQFGKVLETALERNKQVSACYDSKGVVYQLTIQD
jgi:uncharacterized protein (TIGR03437 family)